MYYPSLSLDDLLLYIDLKGISHSSVAYLTQTHTHTCIYLHTVHMHIHIHIWESPGNFVLFLVQLSMLKGVSSMGVLVEHSFLDAYAGESRDGSSAAKFSSGDIISMNSASTTNRDMSDLCYAALALFRSKFAKMEGIASGLCLKCQSMPTVICIQVWKSLQFCYSWILNVDNKKWMLPYLEHLSTFDMKYDIYRVVYVSGDINNNGVNVHDSSSPHHQMLESAEGSFTDSNTRLGAKTCWNYSLFITYITFVNDVYQFCTLLRMFIFAL